MGEKVFPILLVFKKTRNACFQFSLSNYTLCIGSIHSTDQRGVKGREGGGGKGIT